MMLALLAVHISAVLVAANDRPKTVVESMREYCRHVAIVFYTRYNFNEVLLGVERRKRASTILEVLDSETCMGRTVNWINRTAFNPPTLED